jgi:23S rRNA (guanosine2251-2'-O)-methyltransferase
MNEKVYIYGINAVFDVLKYKPEQLLQVWLKDNISNKRLNKLIDLIQQHKILLVRVPEKKIEQITGTSKNQGIVAIIKQPESLNSKTALEFIKKIHNPLILILDGLQDPRNVGACLRTANASGVDLIVTPRSRTITKTPVVSKVSAGASALMPIAEIPNLVRFMKELKQLGVWIFGTSDQANLNYWQGDYTCPMAIVVGSEGKGMRTLTKKNCDYLISIPMIGQIESLNVSVATGILLYEVVRQRSNNLV